MNNHHRHLDARSPLVLETHELTRRAGTMKELHREVEAPADLGIDMIGVPQGSPASPVLFGTFRRSRSDSETPASGRPRPSAG